MTTPQNTHRYPTNADLQLYRERTADLINAGWQFSEHASVRAGKGTPATAIFPRWSTVEPLFWMQSSSGSTLATIRPEANTVTLSHRLRGPDGEFGGTYPLR